MALNVFDFPVKEQKSKPYPPAGSGLLFEYSVKAIPNKRPSIQFRQSRRFIVVIPLYLENDARFEITIPVVEFSA